MAKGSLVFFADTFIVVVLADAFIAVALADAIFVLFSIIFCFLLLLLMSS